MLFSLERFTEVILNLLLILQEHFPPDCQGKDPDQDDEVEEIIHLFWQWLAPWLTHWYVGVQGRWRHQPYPHLACQGHGLLEVGSEGKKWHRLLVLCQNEGSGIVNTDTEHKSHQWIVETIVPVSVTMKKSARRMASTTSDTGDTSSKQDQAQRKENTTWVRSLFHQSITAILTEEKKRSSY